MNFEVANNYLNDVKSFFDRNNIDLNDSWEMRVFPQWWENTSGGLELLGGASLTKQHTCVVMNLNHSFIFFDGNFGYKVKNNTTFLEDLARCKIKGSKKSKEVYEVLDLAFK